MSATQLIEPQALAAEERLLGALLLAGADGPAACRRVAATVEGTGLRERDFFRASHCRIFEAVRAIVDRGEPAEAVFVEAELERRGDLESIGGVARLRELAVLAPAVGNAEHYARLVQEAASRRNLQRGALALADAASNGDQTAIVEGIEFVSALRDAPARNRIALPFELLTEKLAQVPSEPEWLWYGYLAPEVVTLLAASPKVGKTTMIFGLLAALTNGRPFLGRKSRHAQALLLSEERGPGLREKAERLGDDLHLLTHAERAGRSWPEIVSQAAAYCHEHDLSVLVVDTFAPWADLHGDAENDAGAVIEALAPLLDAAASGLAVLIVVHQRKSGGEHGEAVRGSSALPGAVDVIVELERERGLADNTRALKSVSRFPSTPAALVFRFDGQRFEPFGDLGEARAVSETQKIIACLAESAATMTADEIAEASALPPSTVRERLREADGVERTGRGVRGDPYRFSFRTAQPPGAETKRDSSEAAGRVTDEHYEPDESPLAGELLGALKLVRDLHSAGLDVAEIGEATRLEPHRVATALLGEREAA